MNHNLTYRYKPPIRVHYPKEQNTYLPDISILYSYI
jgi:hypothetical protein